jgi:hypothetical protein
VRCAMRLSRFAAFVLRAYALAVAAALILDAPLAAAGIGIVGLAHGAVIALRTVEFSRLMPRIIETVAQREGLLPVEPTERPPIAEPAPRPA